MPIPSLDQEHFHFRDHKTEAELFSSRVFISFLAVVLLFSVLIYRFYTLQIVDYQDYVTRADSNRIQVEPLPPKRGLIYDRNGVLIADNRASYTLSIVKERTKDLAFTLDKVAEIIPVEQDDVDQFYKALKQRRRPYEAVPLRYRLSEDEIAKIAVNEYQLDGVEVQAQLVRHYPFGDLFAHAIGYVGRINERELEGFDPDTYRKYSGTHTIGKIGLEKQYEDYLLGDVGSQHIETNAHGRVLRVLERVDPQPGQDLHLHLDIKLQEAAAKALNGERGAVVAIDVNNGGVLSLTSTPSFDANLFVTGISYKDYKALNESRDLPLFNRTIQGQYPPGSTLKPMLGLGGLDSGVITPQWSIRDPGFYQLEGEERIHRDWKKWGHGNHVDLRQAIVESCNTFYYDLSIRMGIDVMFPVGDAFGLGEHTHIDIPNERSGIWPSREWKRRVRGLPWFPGDTLNVAVGQGDSLVTPLQLAVMVATIARRGDRFQPQLVSRIGNDPALPIQVTTWETKEEHWDYVLSSMKDVVHSFRGTAKAISKDLNYTIGGKTGTAQLVSIAQDEEYDRDKVAARKRDNALFIAFAPVEQPEIAVAVVIENGEHGSSAAAPVARKVMDAWFEIEAARKREAAEKTLAAEAEL